MQLKIIKTWWIDSNKISVVFNRDIIFVPDVEIFGAEFLPSYKITRASGRDFAKYSSYYITDGKINFLLDDQNFCNVRAVKDADYFVCGDFNNWEKSVGDNNWLMEKSTGVFERKLTIPLEKLNLKNRTAHFKFAGADGRWLEPRPDLPNVERDKHGNSNLRLSLDKTGQHVFIIEFDGLVPLSESLKLNFPQLNLQCEVDPAQLLLRLYSNAKLGSYFENGKTYFSIFAPRATRAQVFWKMKDEHVAHVIEAESNDTIIWTAKADFDLSGARYFWRIDGINRNNTSSFDNNFKVADPYANAMLTSNGPSIVKFDKNLPVKSHNFTPPKWHDLFIVEAHLRDLLAKAQADLSPKERLTFAGLTKWLKSENCYLRNIGANCIELQPIQEFTAENYSDYEWGYMPVNWFAPTSSYASDPENASQNDDFANLVKAFHDAGLAVILDVVYNHVGEPNYIERIDKEYYFETDISSNLMNFSGCGNDFRSSAPMAKRMILDSLKKLVINYGVDGFRFDLAELVGFATLKEIETEMKKINPSIILIAEPWSFRGHIAGALRDTGYASWNDGFREFMLSYALNKGDINGFKYFVSGSRDITRFSAQTVNYLESHDDKCLFDRITTLCEHPSLDDLRRYKLAYSLVFLSIGIPMAEEGFDLVRTKQGKNNTYKDGKANELDYARATRFTGVCQWLRGLAKFRQSHFGKALRIDGELPNGWIKFFEIENSSAIGVMFNAIKDKNCKQIFATFNPTDSEVELPIDDNFNFKQIADIDRFDERGLDNPISLINNGKLRLARVSMSLWIEQ